ncbi:hypothetical protein AB6802_04660 [Mesorhizobium sp. RCC_202]|uniref:hypothetical protein n=1 Tax=Mesorhizobium sp. RCC_202 TaxID=3239222 RepID=UPI0035231EA9
MQTILWKVTAEFTAAVICRRSIRVARHRGQRSEASIAFNPFRFPDRPTALNDCISAKRTGPVASLSDVVNKRSSPRAKAVVAAHVPLPDGGSDLFARLAADHGLAGERRGLGAVDLQ